MPQWVEDCIKKYMKKGMSREEAGHRCFGAYNSGKKSETSKRKSRTGPLHKK